MTITDILTNQLPTTVQQPRKKPQQNVIRNSHAAQSIPAPPPCLGGGEVLPGQHRLVWALQYIYGLRSVEALNLTVSDIHRTGIVFIKARKQSNPRFIYAPFLLPFRPQSITFADARLFSIKYKAYYLQLKRHNLFVRPTAGRINNIVTHLNRHSIFQELKDFFSLDNKTVQLFSGHASISGLQYYLDENSFLIENLNSTNPNKPEEV